MDIEQKWKLILEARKRFEPLREEEEDKIKGQLKYFSVEILAAAQATYIAKVLSGNGSFYGSAYFMGILRNKQEAKAKQNYNEAYRASIEKAVLEIPSEMKTEDECARIIISEIEASLGEPSKSQMLLNLESISWALVRYSESSSLTALWQRVQDLATRTFSISFKFWQQVNEYLSDRLGYSLYMDFSPHRHSI